MRLSEELMQSVSALCHEITSKFLPTSEPKQSIRDQPILIFTAKSLRQFLFRVFVIHVVVTHVEINHPVVFVRPNHRVISFVPDFVELGAGSERKACGID